MKYRTLATTKLGSTKLTFKDSDEFKQFIAALQGDVLVEFTQLNMEASNKQWFYFREVLVAKFQSLASKSGTYLSKTKAIEMLVHEVGAKNVQLEQFFVSETYEEHLAVALKKQVAEFIAACEIWIKDFFSI